MRTMTIICANCLHLIQQKVAIPDQEHFAIYVKPCGNSDCENWRQENRSKSQKIEENTRKQAKTLENQQYNSRKG